MGGCVSPVRPRRGGGAGGGAVPGRPLLSRGRGGPVQPRRGGPLAGEGGGGRLRRGPVFAGDTLFERACAIGPAGGVRTGGGNLVRRPDQRNTRSGEGRTVGPPRRRGGLRRRPGDPRFRAFLGPGGNPRPGTGGELVPAGGGGRQPAGRARLWAGPAAPPGDARDAQRGGAPFRQGGRCRPADRGVCARGHAGARCRGGRRSGGGRAALQAGGGARLPLGAGPLGARPAAWPRRQAQPGRGRVMAAPRRPGRAIPRRRRGSATSMPRAANCRRTMPRRRPGSVVLPRRATNPRPGRWR